MAEHLRLKWGTVKGWNDLSDQSMEIMKRFFADGVCMSAAMDRLEKDRREVLCELIDQIDGEIINDWTGKTMDKAEAKRYVIEYR